MIDIETRYDEEHRDWLGFTTESPYMCVSADTEEIARSVVEKGLAWYLEKQVSRRQLEVIAALSEVIPFKTKGQDADTLPSEILAVDEAHYMNKDEG